MASGLGIHLTIIQYITAAFQTMVMVASMLFLHLIIQYITAAFQTMVMASGLGIPQTIQYTIVILRMMESLYLALHYLISFITFITIL